MTTSNRPLGMPSIVYIQNPPVKHSENILGPNCSENTKLDRYSLKLKYRLCLELVESLRSDCV